MGYITEAELREKWRAGVTQFDFPVGTRFSPSAIDFIKQWNLGVLVGGEPFVVSGTQIHHYSEGGLPYLEPKLKK